MEIPQRLTHEALRNIAGGAAALIQLLLTEMRGFAIFWWTTKIMAATASSVGLTIPFGVYIFKNRALGWLLGPVGILVTTAMSAGWVALAWRRRFRKAQSRQALDHEWPSLSRIVAIPHDGLPCDSPIEPLRSCVK